MSDDAAQTGSRSRAVRVLFALVRIALGIVIASLVTIVIAVFATMLLLRSDFGRAKILAFALPRIQPVLAGHLTVGGLGGDLLHTFIIHDAEITAADGRPAIRARRLEGHFALLALLSGEARIENLRGEGVWFGMHLMPDGRFNLAGLTAPATGPPPDPNAKHIRFVMDHVQLECMLRYDAPTMPDSIRMLEASVHVEGGLEIEGSTVRVPLYHIDGALLAPLAAAAHAHGLLVVADGSLTLHEVGAALTLDEDALHRLLPDELLGRLAPLIDRLGPAQLSVNAEGIVNPIALRFHSAFPRSNSSMAGLVSLAGDGPSWNVTAEVPGARFSSTGALDWTWFGPLEGSVDASELSHLAAFGLPDIGGRARATAKLKRSAHGSELAIDGEATAIRFSSLRVDRIELRGSTKTTIDKSPAGTGEAGVTAHGVHAGALLFDRLVLAAHDDGRALALDVDALGPRKSSLAIRVRGSSVVGGQTRFAAVFEHALVDGKLQIEGQTWTTTQSARVNVGDTIRVDGLALASESARISASGFYETANRHGNRIGARVHAGETDLKKLIALVAPQFAISSGTLSLDAHAAGTAQAPVIDADVNVAVADDTATLSAHYAAGQVRGTLAAMLAGPHFDHLAVKLTGAGDAKSAHVDAAVNLREAPLVSLHGRADFAGIAPFGSALFRRWREIPVAIAGEVKSYPLALVPELANRIGGLLDGKLAVSGTPGHPVGVAALHVVGLQLGTVAFTRFGVDVRIANDAATVNVDAAACTGTLLATARLPKSATAPWHAEARLTDFELDLASLPLAGLRSLKGTVNAEVHVDGTRAVPEVSGFVRARDGAIAFGDSSFVYDHGAIDVALAGHELTMRKLAFNAGGGSFEASGVATLEGLRPVAAAGKASFKKYPISLKGVNGWLSANLDLKIKTNDAGLGGSVTVRDGLVTIADLSRVRSVQSTSVPAGVRYVDDRGLKAEAAKRVAAANEIAEVAKIEARAAADPNAKADASLTVDIPGPFLVEGKEVHAALKGALRIDRVQSEPRIFGEIESTGGTVDLINRRYELSHLDVKFDGSPVPDPQLDVRIERSTDVTVVIDVQGRASDPDVTFSSIPPVYSTEQVMAMILSGSPNATDVGSQSLDDRVAGALSGTFVGQLKDQVLPILPVDVIKVDLVKDSLGQEDTRFEVGKYITESIYVSYVHQLGTVLGLQLLNRNQLQLEYRFARAFEVETSYGDSGVGALDLYWDHRF